MPQFLEEKLKKEYPGDPSAVYGTLNNIGAMHGNKETPKGVAMEAKHNLMHGHTTTAGGKDLATMHKAKLHAAISKRLTAHTNKGPEAADQVNGESKAVEAADLNGD